MKLLLLIGTMIFSMSTFAECVADKDGGCSESKECVDLDKTDSTFQLVYNASTKTCSKSGCKDQKMQFNKPKLSCEPLDCKTIVDSATREKPAVDGSGSSTSGTRTQGK